MAAKKDFVVKNGLVVGITADSATPGQLSWNTDFETLNLNLDPAVTARLTQDQYVLAKAATSISKGAPVYVSDAVGNSGKVEVTPFIANNTIPERRFIGVAAEAMATGEFGFIITFGQVRGISTDGSALTTPETWNDGTILYASPSVAGEFTSTEPTAPNQKLPVAFVISANSTDGVLFIRATDVGRQLNDLNNVNISSISNNQLIAWDSANERWNNISATTSIIGEGSNLYYTKARVDSDVQEGITALIDGAPAALDTLNELAAALNDDANFAATVTGLITALPDSAQVSSIITADVDKAFVDALNVDADTLDGQDGTYYLDYTNFTNTPNVLDSADVITTITLDGFTKYDSANASGQITAALVGYATETYVDNAVAALPDSAQVSSIITADVDKTFIDNLNVDADTLDGQDGTYYLDYTNFTNTPSAGIDSAQATIIAEDVALALSIALG